MRPIYEWWSSAEAEIATRMVKKDEFFVADVIMDRMRNIRYEAIEECVSYVRNHMDSDSQNVKDIRALVPLGDR